MPLIPIRTESPIRRTPWVNIALIGLCIAAYLVFNVSGVPAVAGLKRDLALFTLQPRLHQFLTYQFLHADLMHLAANMLFLWVFGSSVNAKMGHGPYLLLFLGGGVFAAWGFAMTDARGAELIGASGSIAAVTTAYLVLFPLSRVVILSLMFVIGFFRVPAMVLILLKVILWDVVALGADEGGNVAHAAHLAGYAYGFAVALLVLLLRGVQRDHYDLLALWDRAARRFAWRRAMAGNGGAATIDGAWIPGRVVTQRSAADTARLDRAAELRDSISRYLAAGETQQACAAHEQLVMLDAALCLRERDQILIGRAHYEAGRSPQAAAAFERFLAVYRGSTEAPAVALLLGVIYARDLQRNELADAVLTSALDRLTDAARREQCLHWLRHVRAALGRPTA